MGRGGQIQQLLSDVPIDETWVLIGLAILVVAALFFLHGKWREARFGLSSENKSPHSHPAGLYFASWESAGDDVGLEAVPTEEALDAPRLVGTLGGLEATLEMQLQRSGRRDPDPEAINPATVRCRITGRVQLPLPWRDATVRRFIRPKGNNSTDIDDVSLGDELPEEMRLTSASLSRQSRRALAAMVDDFDTVQVVEGTLTVVDYLQPSRNRAEWKQIFAEPMRTLRRQARAFGTGSLTVCVKSPHHDGEQKLSLEGGVDMSQAVDTLREGMQ